MCVNIMPGWIVFVPITLVYGSVVVTWIIRKVLRVTPEPEPLPNDTQEQCQEDQIKQKTE
ncbi:hypothetical protein Hamer_G008694 [Homarus americanus]|uniref:Uncharacterized protein n=1 Tax=Homarus americanus TaxID=6706 RepID=A0A8J5T8G3_HOMAM|nr:hypothetical protein Hamer_G008694 [Homarus americanus]